jgi:hypothetical protein
MSLEFILSNFDFQKRKDFATISGYLRLYNLCAKLKYVLVKLSAKFSNLLISNIIWEWNNNYTFPSLTWESDCTSNESYICFSNSKNVQCIVYLQDNKHIYSDYQDMSFQNNNLGEQTFLQTHSSFNICDLFSLSDPINFSVNGPENGSVQIILWLLLRIITQVDFQDLYINEICLFFLLFNIYLRLLNKESEIYQILVEYNVIFPLDGDLIVDSYYVREYRAFLDMFTENIMVYRLFTSDTYLYPVSDAFIHVFNSTVQYPRATLHSNLYDLREMCIESIDKVNIRVKTTIVSASIIEPSDDLINLSVSHIIMINSDGIFFKFNLIENFRGAHFIKSYLVLFEKLIIYDPISALQIIIFNYEYMKMKTGNTDSSALLFAEYLHVVLSVDKELSELLTPSIPFLVEVIEKEIHQSV